MFHWPFAVHVFWPFHSSFAYSPTYVSILPMIHSLFTFELNYPEITKRLGAPIKCHQVPVHLLQVISSWTTGVRCRSAEEDSVVQANQRPPWQRAHLWEKRITEWQFLSQFCRGGLEQRWIHGPAGLLWWYGPCHDEWRIWRAGQLWLHPWDCW